MGYKLNVTEQADKLLDALVYHLVYRLNNDQAARHLLDEIAGIYERLENNPFQFHICKDEYLAAKGYYEAAVSRMNYIIIFGIKENTVDIVDIFHQLENYVDKL